MDIVALLWCFICCYLVTLPSSISSRSVSGQKRKIRTKRGHNDAISLNEDDPCSNFPADPAGKPKLKPLNLQGRTEHCCACGPGKKLSQLCKPGQYNTTQCTECQTGTFIDEYSHGEPSCFPETKMECPLGEYFIPSTPAFDSSCVCSNGFFRADTNFCKKHSKCPTGMGVSQLGTAFRDTVCEKCNYGFDSPIESATEPCELSISVRELSVNEYSEEIYQVQASSRTTAIVASKTHNINAITTNFVSVTNKTIAAMNNSITTVSFEKHPAIVECSCATIFVLMLLALVTTILISARLWNQIERQNRNDQIMENIILGNVDERNVDENTNKESNEALKEVILDSNCSPSTIPIPASIDEIEQASQDSEKLKFLVYALAEVVEPSATRKLYRYHSTRNLTKVEIILDDAEKSHVSSNEFFIEICTTLNKEIGTKFSRALLLEHFKQHHEFQLYQLVENFEQ